MNYGLLFPFLALSTQCRGARWEVETRSGGGAEHRGGWGFDLCEDGGWTSKN